METVTEESRRLEMEFAGPEWEEEWSIKILRRGQRGRKTAGRGHLGRGKERAIIVSPAGQ